MGVQKGDFIGFTFDNTHSSELGLIRVSDGSRYTENLLPTIQTKTVQVPGGDGTYYFGSYYTQKAFSFPVAFDSLSEEQLRTIKRKFGDKKIHKLVFDETPYKFYKVKTTGAPNLKFVAFDKNEDYCCTNEVLTGKDEIYKINPEYSMSRIYKGEGTLSFTAYSPFAFSRFKYRDYYNSENCPELNQSQSVDQIYYNLDAWIKSSGLKLSTAYMTYNSKNYVIDQPQSEGVAVYNPGDFDTHFKLKFNLSSNQNSNGKCYFPGGYIWAARDSETAATEKLRKNLKLGSFVLKDGDVGIQINTQLNLIEGFGANGELTGTVYNTYIEEGDFFKIPITSELCMMQFELASKINSNLISIEYDYLYF